ncbi:iron chelate uptake ABC transporter family permease subunit [Streptomyces griseobrunneus]
MGEDAARGLGVRVERSQLLGAAVAVAVLLSGALFGLAGALYQRLIRNPLATPDIVGISADAGAGATTVLLFAPALPLGAPLAAVTGSLVLLAAVYRHAPTPAADLPVRLGAALAGRAERPGGPGRPAGAPLRRHRLGPPAVGAGALGRAVTPGPAGTGVRNGIMRAHCGRVAGPATGFRPARRAA